MQSEREPMSESQDPIVSFNDEPLILVDSDDTVIGYKDKWQTHQGEGELHRAFSIFIFNERNELLIQQRSDQKHLWPLVWANSCCSHPRKGEDYLTAVHRRLGEELNLKAELKFLFKFEYHATYKDVGSENELCSVYVGRCSDAASANRNEVAQFRYISPEELDQALAADEASDADDEYSPWLKLEWARIRGEFWDEVEKL